MAEPYLTNSLTPVQHQVITLLPEQTQQLQLIMHMATYGNMLVAVSGQEGSGKTTLALEVAKHHNHSEDTLYIAADLMFGIPSLLRRIGDLSNTPLSDNRHQAVEQLSIIAQQRASEGRTILVTIDQAEQLDVETLNEIAEVAKQISSGLAFILLGKTGYEMQFKRTSEQAPIHLQALQPLSKDSAKQLLLQHFKTEELPFSDAAFLNLYQLSMGWPGELLLHALEQRGDSVSSNTTMKQKIADVSKSDQDGKKFPVIHLVALVVLAAALGIAYLFQPSVEEVPEAEVLVAEVEDVLRGSLPRPAPSEIKPIKPAVEVAQDHSTEAVPVLPVEPVAVVEDTVVVDIPEVVEDVVAVEEEAAAVVPPQSKPAPVAAVKAPASKFMAELEQDKVRLQAIKQGAVVQVFGSHSLDNALNFKRNWQSKINQTMYLYPSLHKDKEWYGVVVGGFTDKRQAGQSIKQWPAALKKDHWVRNIQDVQQIMR